MGMTIQTRPASTSAMARVSSSVFLKKNVDGDVGREHRR